MCIVIPGNSLTNYMQELWNSLSTFSCGISEIDTLVLISFELLVLPFQIYPFYLLLLKGNSRTQPVNSKLFSQENNLPM